MVKTIVLLAVLAVGTQGWALDPSPVPTPSSGADAKDDKAPGPVLIGDGGGRIWKWEDGQKTWLTPEGTDLTVGGVGEKELWGLASAGDQVRFFTLELPKKKDKIKDPGKDPSKPVPKENAGPPPVPKYDKGTYPVPDLADRAENRVLLVYGAQSGHPRYEVWTAGVKTSARAWDDGRVVYALALGPKGGWVIAGRTGSGTPWLEVSGQPVDAPEGWRGRLTAAAWVPEADLDKKDGADKKPGDQKSAPEPQASTKAGAPVDPKKPKVPPPVHPWAAGWGAPGSGVPRALFWGPDGWTQPAPPTDGSGPAGGVYPVLGAPGDQGTLTLAGWRADPVTGAKQPWFWDGSAGTSEGALTDGEPSAFSLAGKGGAAMVVRHSSAPWFTLEGGAEPVTLVGLDADDHVRALVAADGAQPAEGPTP